MTKKPLADHLEALRSSYAETLPEKLVALRQVLESLRKSANDPRSLDDAVALAHRLKGTAGTYGFFEVSRFAGALEQRLDEYKANPAAPPAWEDMNDELDDLIRKCEFAAAAGRPAPTAAQGHILVIDDDPAFLQLLSALLSECGFRVTVTTKVDTVVELVLDEKPDLVLLDVEMPTESGFDVCRRIRKSPPPVSEIPIIFLTAHNNPENRIAAFEAHADDFINKPIVREELLARVTVRLQHAGLMRERKEMIHRLQSQHQTLLSILDQLKIGTIIIGERNRIEFISRSCGGLGGIEPEWAAGKTWQDALPFDPETRSKIDRLLKLSGQERPRLLLHWQADRGQEYWVECEIQNDPEDPRRRLLYLYDQSELHRLRQQIDQSRFGQMIGDSEPMRQMYDLIQQVARGDWTVLVEGETGVGKELVAHSIHAASPRKEGPFIAVNSAGLSESLLASQLFGHRRGAFTGAVADQEGFFEAASGGTLFLDEIGDLPLSMQAALLRVLQEKEITRVGETRTRKVDVRVIAATHKDLSGEVRLGRFREDLFYRLRVARIHVPALRERRGDIPMLAQTFLAETCRTAGQQVKLISPDAMRRLQSHDWPGNVRELKATLDYAVIRCRGDRLLPEDLPPELLKPASPTRETFEGDERERILAALKQTDGNRTHAARLLGISRATFYRRLADLDITNTE